jgi:hypothetical protein
MKKLIEIVKQFLGLGKTAKAITTITQLKNEVKESIVEVKEKVEEVKKKKRYYSKPKPKQSVESTSDRKPKSSVEPTSEKKPKKTNKPKQQ